MKSGEIIESVETLLSYNVKVWSRGIQASQIWDLRPVSFPNVTSELDKENQTSDLRSSAAWKKELICLCDQRSNIDWVKPAEIQVVLFGKPCPLTLPFQDWSQTRVRVIPDVLVWILLWCHHSWDSFVLLCHMDLCACLILFIV